MSDIYGRDLVAGASFKQTSTDTAVVLTAASLLSASGNRAAAVHISCQTQTVRFGFGGATLTQGAGGLGHDLADKGSMYVEGAGTVKSMKVISATNGSHGVLTITPFFEAGR